MKKNIMFAMAALLASGSAMAIDNYSGVSTSLTAMAYDNQNTNAVNGSSAVNPVTGVYAGFSGTYAGVASSNNATVAAATPTGAGINGTYNRIGDVAEGGRTSGSQAFASVTPNTAVPSSAYVYGDNVVGGASSVNKFGYSADAISGNNQQVTLIGNGVQSGQVNGATDVRSQSSLLGAADSANATGSHAGNALINLSASTAITAIGNITR